MKKFKTFKAAREAGYKEECKWISSHKIPKKRAKGIEVKGRLVYSEKQCEGIYSITSINGLGRKLKPNANAVCEKWWKGTLYNLYRLSDTIPKKKRHNKEPELIDDFLLALFVVNRAAKRQRDNARKYYMHEMYGLATYAKNEKEWLYNYKNKGMGYAIKNGLVVYVGHHGELAFFKGQGYSFHQPDFSVNNRIQLTNEEIFVESKPRSKEEPRLKDCIYTIQKTLQAEKQRIINRINEEKLIRGYHHEAAHFLASVMSDYIDSRLIHVELIEGEVLAQHQRAILTKYWEEPDVYIFEDYKFYTLAGYAANFVFKDFEYFCQSLEIFIDEYLYMEVYGQLSEHGNHVDDVTKFLDIVEKVEGQVDTDLYLFKSLQKAVKKIEQFKGLVEEISDKIEKEVRIEGGQLEDLKNYVKSKINSNYTIIEHSAKKIKLPSEPIQIHYQNLSIAL